MLEEMHELPLSLRYDEHLWVCIILLWRCNAGRNARATCVIEVDILYIISRSQPRKEQGPLAGQCSICTGPALGGKSMRMLSNHPDLKAMQKAISKEQINPGSLLVPRRGFVLQVTSTIASLFYPTLPTRGFDQFPAATQRRLQHVDHPSLYPTGGPRSSDGTRARVLGLTLIRWVVNLLTTILFVSNNSSIGNNLFPPCLLRNKNGRAPTPAPCPVTSATN
jgi:hypothetical protein